MQSDQTRRTFLVGSAATGTLALAGCLGGDDDAENGDEEEAVDGYELWALDQGTDTIHFYEPDGDEFEHTDEIDLNGLETPDGDTLPDEGIVPHMMDYSSDYEYAAIACTAGARTLVFRTDDHELVADIDTGGGSHMAAFSPDDDYIHVDAIGEEAIVRVEADLDEESFEVVDEIDVREDDTITEAGIDSGAPICHQYTHDGRSVHTLGPSYHDGALVIVDHDDFTVDRAYSGEELPTNCGTMPHPTEEKFYLTAGLPSDPDADPEEDPLDADGVGDYYVYDTAENEVVVDGESTEGIDAHGFWFTPDGEELWVLNRETNDGVVLDPETDDVIEEIDAYGPAQSDDVNERDAPDILWASPDGEYMFATLRGPAPLSGDPHAATGVTPGVSVLDTESRDIETVLEPDPIEDYSDEDIQAVLDEEDDAPQVPDFHGLGVRPIGEHDTDISTSPPF